MAQPVKGHGAVVREFGKMAVEELTFLPPGPGEIRLKVHACGICSSDIAFMTGKIPSPLPLIIGHEGAGVVEAVGEGVSMLPGSVKVGDWAVLTLVAPCNRCNLCRSGRPSICSDRTALPVNKVLDAAGKPMSIMTGIGCMAEYVVVSEGSVVKVGKDVPLQKCCLVSCGVTTGCGAAMNRAKVNPGSSCCVLGCGGVGLNAIQGCRICGAGQIIAVDTLPSKLEAARRFGATHTVNAKEVKDVVSEVKKITGGRGADYGFEVIGLTSTAQQAVDVLCPGGLAVMVGLTKPEESIPVRPLELLTTEKMVTGSLMGSGVPAVQVPLLIELYKNGMLMLDELVSRYYHLKDAQAAIDDLLAGNNLRGVLVMHDLESLASRGASRL